MADEGSEHAVQITGNYFALIQLLMTLEVIEDVLQLGFQLNPQFDFKAGLLRQFSQLLFYLFSIVAFLQPAPVRLILRFHVG